MIKNWWNKNPFLVQFNRLYRQTLTNWYNFVLILLTEKWKELKIIKQIVNVRFMKLVNFAERKYEKKIALRQKAKKTTNKGLK